MTLSLVTELKEAFIASAATWTRHFFIMVTVLVQLKPTCHVFIVAAMVAACTEIDKSLGILMTNTTLTQRRRSWL